MCIFLHSVTHKIISYHLMHRWACLLVIACISVPCRTAQRQDIPVAMCGENLILADADSVCNLDREQEKAPLCTIWQQRKGAIFGFGSVLLFIVCLWTISLIQIQHNRAKQLQQEQAMTNALHEQECLRLEQESERLRLQAKLAQSQLTQRNEVLEAKSLYLHRTLSERIELAKHIKQSMPMLEKGVPAWLQAYVDRYLFVSDDNWQAFLIEFRLVYGDFIPYVQARYPALSDSDIQYIILVVLGMSNSDIAFVLSKTQRTIWNRRNTICMRAGIASSSLDEWARQLPDDYVRSCVDSEPSNDVGSKI